jgi:hypothetical protein
MAFDPRLIDDLAQRLAGAVPGSVSALRRDLEQNFKGVLQSQLSRLDLRSVEQLRTRVHGDEDSHHDEQHAEGPAQRRLRQSPPETVPGKLPTMPTAATASSTGQSRSRPWASSTRRYFAKPVKEFSVITARLVPTALAIGTPASSTSAGTIRNPPPTPTRPLSSPTAVPPAITVIRLELRGQDGW